MKILAVHNHYQAYGGEDRVFADETAMLERAGHTVLRFSRHNDAIETMGRTALAVKTVHNREVERELVALLARERPDVMHCHNTFPLVSPAAYRAARRSGVAVVQTLHNFRLACPKAVLMREGRICERCVGRTVPLPAIRHRCYRDDRAASAMLAGMLAVHNAAGTWTRGVDRFVTPTVFMKNKFVEHGFDPARIAVKPNFVSGDIRPGEGERQGAVFVGRLSAEKGIECLLEAWRAVEGDTSLSIVGDGPLLPEVRAAAARDKRIRWLGHLEKNAVMRVMGGARLLVMPSIWYEAFGLCIVEAFSKGVPVVASRLGAMKELIDEDVSGLCFEPGDPHDLARTVNALVSDEPRLEAMGAAARVVFETRFTPAANLPLLLDIYDDARKANRESV